MTAKANAIRTLYRAKRISLDAVRKAVADNLITVDEFKEITGKEYT